MYLKNLTVLGFKSFADKTSLNFQPGITAIVGPNGCGKSNVADAIRWVLGEQSARALRGGEMADVIFNGTDGRRPLGMAEVSLTIGDVDGEHLKAAGIEVTFNEVTITRRIFRDGGSEYFINKVPCRLRDIQQFFMGTGMGKTSYSIMAQGHITQIIQSKPEDRRMVFEEAAGITKFKAQKKESLRKLEHTDQNLLRVEDLIREVKRQIGSLQRQAGKARRYKQVALELQHLDTQLARHQFDTLQAEISQRTTEAEQLRTAMEDLSQNVLRTEDELLQLRHRLSELDAEINTSQQQGLELKSQTERHEHRIQFNEERLRELEAQNSKAFRDINESEERIGYARQELVSVTQRLAESQQKLETLRGELGAKQQAVQTVERELITRQEELRRAQTEAFNSSQQLSRVRNEINALDLQKQGNVVRLEKLSSEKIQLEEERARLDARLTEFAANVESEKAGVVAQRGTVEERQKRLREIQQEINQVSQELDTVLRAQAGVKSRLNVLEQLQGSHEGFSAGAQAALKQSKLALGTLADRIRVPDQYVIAVETALGHHLQLVLTEQPEAATQIFADLVANKKGRANIGCLGLKNPDFKPAGAEENAPGESALKVIEADESVAYLINGLLGNTRIVADLAAATAAWQQTNGAYSFATLTGDLLNRQGIFTGGYLSGAANGKAPSSILGRKNQIAELQKQIADSQAQGDEISRRKGALQSEQTELQAGLQQAQTDLRAQEVAIASREGEFKALKASLQNLHLRIDTVVYEIQSLASQEQEGNAKREKLAAQITELETREQSVTARVADLGGNIDSLRQQRDAALSEQNDTKVATATEEQLVRSFAGQKAPLEGRIRELEQLIQTRQNEIGAFGQRKTQAETEITDSRQQIERLRHEREQISRHIAGLGTRKTAQEGDIQLREEGLREQRKQLGDLQSRRGSIDIELTQKTMQVQNLRQRVQEKYQLNLDDIRSECITITFADEGQPKVETVTPDEMVLRGMATDWVKVAEQVGILQKKLDEMGAVNHASIEEYEEAETRHAFLTKQFDDLVQAKAQLMEVINKINTQTKEMFAQTFAKIRDNFRAMFVEIFGGGKADLVLVDENDLLESGVEIVAKPPGKQLQSISLLSGGEQTMTAVALLFSIYQVKPSPFCVLDELDAPLDESNINRFIRVLQRFLNESQFIIITHNKRTIGIADVLYGVTMQEHGVSKIVSVKFHKQDEPSAERTSAKPLVPPAAAPDVETEENASHKREETLEIVMAK
ncbi:MAG: chromosome segregation protein SMC [Limisphaerales bacterium]